MVKAGLVSLVERRTPQNEDSSILSSLFTAFLPSAVHQTQHFIDYSVQTEATQLLLRSENWSRNKTSSPSGIHKRDSLYAMQRSSVSHLRHRPSASCAFMWHLTKTSVQRSVSSQTRAEKNPAAAKAPVHCPAPAGCLKHAFTYSSRITAFHCQNRDKHHPCCHKNHRKAECSYHVINHSLPRTEGILLPLKTQVTEKLSKG